ncbi:hypothetical protein HanLR1_Chr12g0439291 [Helianthus annuus]|nr:hypothetical protein HanLR1_Chr12g0439291 [Helianthus annuus]
MKASRRGGWGRFIIPSDFTPTSSLQQLWCLPLFTSQTPAPSFTVRLSFFSQAQRFSLMRLRI